VRRALLVALAAGLAMSISLAQTAAVALAVVLALGRGERRLAFPLAAPLLAFVGWTAVTAVASARPGESLAASRPVILLGLVWVVANALENRRAVQRFATLLFALVAFVGLVAIAQVAFCPPAPPAFPVLSKVFRKCDRAHGFYSIYMTLAGVLAMVLVAAAPRLGRAVPLGWGLPGWIAGVVALGLTYTRGAWAGFALGVVAVLAIARRRLLLASALVAVLLAVVAVPPLRDRVVDRVRGIVKLEDNTLLDRLAMVTGSLAIVRDHPWTGVGPGQVKHAYPAYAPPEALRRQTSHVHNTPLQVLIERGIPGLALWVAIFAAFFARATAIYRALPAGEDRALVGGVLGAIAAFLVAGLFEYNFGDSEVLMVACALMALPFALERRGQTQT
jgi:O-antigen ligase